MSTDTKLTGLSVLVIEDDYFLADDTRVALEEAGAQVLGPYAEFGDAAGSLAQTRPDCAVLDVNLGHGPDFSTAEAMRRDGVPILFVTGYDGAIIPPALGPTACLQKPTTAAKIVEAVRELCDA